MEEATPQGGERSEGTENLKEFQENIASWVAKQLLAKVRGMGAADKAALTAKLHNFLADE